MKKNKKNKVKTTRETAADMINKLLEPEEMTIRKLSYAMDVSESTIHRWRKGLNKPHGIYMKKLRELCT